MSSNRTIAKNTIFLYFRMIITMVISLYTSRVIINALGFIDYGLYSVVGGITGIIAFMHSSLAGATIRFMNIEMGKNDCDNLRSVFNSAVIIHIGLSILIFVLGETCGLWFVFNKLSFPEGRSDAVFWVYQFSLISVIVTVLQTPYDAAVVAHQKMSVYAYFSILDVIMKLLIAYIVYITTINKLVIYSALVLLVSIFTRLIFQFYCRKNFAECRFKWIIKKKYIRSIGYFFGWDLFGNFSVVAKYQGIQILLNIFFGAIVNSAVAIANTVSNIVSGFANNFSVAAKPQIFQLYAEGKNKEMLDLLFFSSRITFFMMFIFSIPFIIKTDFFLKLWLVEIPPYASMFCRLIFFQILINSFFSVLNYPIHATGKIKGLSVIGGLIIIANIPLSYICLKMGAKPEITLYIGIILSFFGGIANLNILKKLVPEFSVFKYVVIMCTNLSIVLLGIIPGLILQLYLDKSFISTLTIISIIMIGCVSAVFSFGLKHKERREIYSKIKIIINKKLI